MIFVTVGTQDKQFKRLLVEVERLIKVGKITEPVVAQVGNTKFTTDLEDSKMRIIEVTLQRRLLGLFMRLVVELHAAGVLLL